MNHPPGSSFPAAGLAIVIGAQGGIGAAVLARLAADTGPGASSAFARVMGFSRNSDPALDLTDETSIVQAARRVAACDLPLRLVFDASGFLHGDGFEPEKRLAQLDPAHLAHAFAVNAIGPALLMKHLLPLLPRDGKSVFATLSAKVGSIGDNRLGGWYSYRASKAALNQLVRTAAIELRRRAPEAICVALHPGTTDTALSRPFAKSGLDVRDAPTAAKQLIGVIHHLSPDDSGGFFDYQGRSLPW